jgi:TetR/AcrR family transcriptional repressor of bet genes
MEPIRRAALLKATIAQIGETGSLDVTVTQIARRAGMSSALAHHYFGSKEQIFLAAMRHTMTVYGAEVRGALSMASDHKSRLQAIIRAGFGPANFRPEVIAAWLNFYVLARTNADGARLLAIYHARLRSNLLYDLRPLVGARAPDVAERLAGLIDGLYLRDGLRADPRAAAAGRSAVALVLQGLDIELSRGDGPGQGALS